MATEDASRQTLINSKTRSKVRTRRLHKGLALAVIVFCLSMQIRANLRPPQVDARAARTESAAAGGSPLVQELRYRFALLVWQLDRIAWFCGLSTHWRMFAPPPKSHWYYSVWAIMDDGSQEWVPLENQGARSWLQRQFLDFREVKFHLNIYNRPEALDAFAQHLCGKLTRNGKRAAAVRFTLLSREILPLRVALEQGEYYGPQTVTEFGTYKCSFPSAS